MKGDTSIDLARAYRAATYLVLTQPPIPLLLGQDNPRIMALGEPLGVTCWAWLTACNPRSRRLRPAANARRMRALHQGIARLGHPLFPGRASDPSGKWPCEPSLLVGNMGPDQAAAWARRFGQAAWVRIGPQGMACLQWLHDQAPRNAWDPDAVC